MVCKYVHACIVNILWSLPKYVNAPISYLGVMKYSPTTQIEPYLLCMQAYNLFTKYHLYATHRRLCCNTTVKIKKAIWKEAHSLL